MPIDLSSFTGLLTPTLDDLLGDLGLGNLADVTVTPFGGLITELVDTVQPRSSPLCRSGVRLHRREEQTGCGRRRRRRYDLNLGGLLWAWKHFQRVAGPRRVRGDLSHLNPDGLLGALGLGDLANITACPTAS